MTKRGGKEEREKKEGIVVFIFVKCTRLFQICYCKNCLGMLNKIWNSLGCLLILLGCISVLFVSRMHKISA